MQSDKSFAEFDAEFERVGPNFSFKNVNNLLKRLNQFVVVNFVDKFKVNFDDLRKSGSQKLDCHRFVK